MTPVQARRGAAAIEYLMVVIVAVMILVLPGEDGKNPLFELARAFVQFYADYSHAISVATP